MKGLFYISGIYGGVMPIARYATTKERTDLLLEPENVWYDEAILSYTLITNRKIRRTP